MHFILMNKIILIIPFFGHLPEYFKAWLATAANLRCIDFVIFTDDSIDDQLPANVSVHQMQLRDMQDLISSKMKLIGINKFDIGHSYKLCEYKPAYGYIFSDYINGYDFWGFCDIDLIWGDLNKYLDLINISEYDKVYQFGHLTIFRNNPEINLLFNSNIVKHEYSFANCVDSSRVNHFDEIGLNLIFEKSGKRMYWDDFSVTPPFKCEMRHSNPKYRNLPGVFIYVPNKNEDGSIKNTTYYVCKEGDRISFVECSYIHFMNHKQLKFGDVDFTQPFVISHKGVRNISLNEDYLRLINEYGYPSSKELFNKRINDKISTIRRRYKNFIREVKYRGGLVKTLQIYIDILKTSRKYGKNVNDLYRDELGRP